VIATAWLRPVGARSSATTSARTARRPLLDGLVRLQDRVYRSIRGGNAAARAPGGVSDMARTDFDQDPMTVATALIERFNSRDYTGMIEEDGGGAVDYTEVGTGRRITEPGEMVAALTAWVTAFPDVRGTVLSAMRDGDRLCAELHWEGTHTGPLVTASGTLPATGNRTSTRAAELFTIRDGRVVDIVHYLDIMTMMTQLGVVPSPSSGQQERASV
jgi:predicted ester cyclase